jgi:hypothetical protein
MAISMTPARIMPISAIQSPRVPSTATTGAAAGSTFSRLTLVAVSQLPIPKSVNGTMK